MNALLSDRAYYVLAVAVFVLLAVHVSHHDYVGDFWEHAAVVRELATHPSAPGNPLVATDEPHPTFSPYTLVLAVVARVSGADPVHVLAVAGLPNLVLWLICLRAFVTRAFGREASVPVLLCTLLLWGHAPWFYSGFMHIDVLGSCLSYPATFAIALMFAALAVEIGFLRDPSKRVVRFGALVVLVATVILTHPLTAIPTCIAMLAFAADTANAQRVRNVISIAVVIGSSFLLALAWPYYPVWKLLTSESSATYATNQWMYPGLRATFVQLYAAVIGIPMLFARLRRRRLDALVLAFIGLAMVYAYGYATERWSYGRVLSSMVFILQLATADSVTRALRDLSGPRSARMRDAMVLVPVAVLFVAMMVEFAPTLDRYVRGRNVVTVEQAYSFLGDRVPAGAVVLSKVGLRDDASSYVIAAYGGKVVAAPVLMFVPDAAERLADVRRFFSAYVSQDERRAILGKYRADYLLVQGSTDDDSLRWAWDLGNVVYNTDDVLLFDIAQTGP